jgi:hypothetical protein
VILMDKEKILKSILSSVQWDVWKFNLSGKQLVKQKLAIISHGHGDHIPSDLLTFDLVLLPSGIQVPRQLEALKNAVCVDRFCRVGKMQFAHIGPKTLTRMLGQYVPSTHARWWLTTYSKCNVLFIGDADARDVPVFMSFVDKMFSRGYQIHSVLLPSFGLTVSHGWNLCSAMLEAIDKLKNEYGIIIGGLPHPIVAEWADYNAVRSKSIVET